MGPLFIIVPWLMVAAVFALIFFVFKKLYQYAKQKAASGGGAWAFFKWLSFIPVVAMIVGAVVFAVFLVFSYVDSQLSGTIFESTFQQEAPPEVQGLQTEASGFGDYLSQYMQFQIEPDNFGRLVPPRFKQVQKKEIQSHMFYDAGSPEWWPESWDQAWLYYFRSKSHFDEQPGVKGFASEHEVLIYDEAARRAYYIFVGID